MNAIFSKFSSAHQACQRHGIYQAVTLCLAVLAALGLLLGTLMLVQGSSSFHQLRIPIYLAMASGGYLLLYLFCLALYGWNPCPAR